MSTTGGLLAQSAGGRDGGMVRRGGGSWVDTQLAGPGALKQWVASKQQAADTERGLTDAHILCSSACLHVGAPFLPSPAALLQCPKVAAMCEAGQLQFHFYTSGSTVET